MTLALRARGTVALVLEALAAFGRGHSVLGEILLREAALWAKGRARRARR